MARQRGYEIVHEYTISGAKSKRPGLDQLMADAFELFLPTGELSPERTTLVDQPSSIDRAYSVLALWLTSDAIIKQYATDEQTGRQFEIGGNECRTSR